MPKIDDGMFRLEIRLDDHHPAHCHAICSDGEVKIKLLEEDVMLYSMLSKSPISGDLNKSTVRKALKAAKKHRKALLNLWNKYHT
ncbi:MAG: DUF4160 domain-containing protein [Cyanobacteria bacterium P01_A01_bin.116]